jgi:hypothetical protein
MSKGLSIIFPLFSSDEDESESIVSALACSACGGSLRIIHFGSQLTSKIESYSLPMHKSIQPALSK